MSEFFPKGSTTEDARAVLERIERQKRPAPGTPLANAISKTRLRLEQNLTNMRTSRIDDEYVPIVRKWLREVLEEAKSVKASRKKNP